MNGINGKLAAAHGHGARGDEFLDEWPLRFQNLWTSLRMPEMAMPWAVFGMRYLSTVELVSSMSLRMPGMTAHEEQLTSKRALQTITTTPARLSTFSARIRQH